MEVEVLDSSPSNLIIRTSGRRFPALVVQGDTFYSWVSDLKEVLSMANACGKSELAEELGSVVETLEERLAHYEAVLERHGIEPPY